MKEYVYQYLNRNLFILSSIILLGFILRIWNLSILDPYTDEYIHFLSARDGILEYQRAKIVTFLINISYYIGSPTSFLDYIYWGRMPSVIMGTLTIIPIYFLGKKVSINTGIISALLWATSPWAIGVSRTAREYAIYPFFILIALLLLIKLFQSKKKGYILLLLSLFLYYTFFIDYLSSLKAVILVFIPSVVFLLIINFEKMKVLNYTFLSAIILIPSFFYIKEGYHISILEEPNLRWLSFFFSNHSPPMHWWNGFQLQYLTLLLFSISFFYALYLRKRYYFLNLIIFTFILFFFVFFFQRYIRERYIFYALPFFIIIISSSIEALFSILKKIKPLPLKIISSTILIFFLFNIFNYQNILYPVVSSSHGYVRTTNEYHDYIREIFTFLEEEIEEEDVIITTLVPAFRINFENKVYGYNYLSEDRFKETDKIIEENDQGFMVLDWRRNVFWNNGYPEGNFFVGEKEVKNILNKDNFYIYRW